MISPGFLTTVQDMGRPGYAHLGISASGAADALALRAANLLVGNPEGAAALEMTLVGGTFVFPAGAVVALTGSDFGANIRMWAAVEVRANEPVRCGASRSGARCYLAVRGGIQVPLLLGSASTHLMTGLGGFHGRALAKGDVLEIGERKRGTPRRLSGPPDASRDLLRATAGPQAGWFRADDFFGAPWQVSEESNRMGLRLRGAALERHEGRMLTEGVSLGAVQVPPEGQPIILFVEHQTTGGYPKIANVISADLHKVGQLRPRDQVQFEQVSIERALALLAKQEEWLHSLA